MIKAIIIKQFERGGNTYFPTQELTFPPSQFIEYYKMGFVKPLKRKIEKKVINKEKSTINGI
jgi:hypothetical protein|tara:strand:+ start:1080 stop:1265 length:186 start_codon:yes stop_codon:yes gene_type:complete